MVCCFSSLLPISLPAPKIVFNRLNGKKYHHPAPALPADEQQEEIFTPAHEENVKFAFEGKGEWTSPTVSPEMRERTFHRRPPAVLWMTLFHYPEFI